MIPVTKLNDEVLYAADRIVRLDGRDIHDLIQQAASNPRRRIRICTHRNADDPLHEMIIVHARDTYVRPHKHPGKTESFHVIEGLVDVVVFDEGGKIIDVIRMGDYSSRREFYYRIADPFYHTLLIQSEVLVFHETANGPFQRSDMIFAPWAPEESDPVKCQEFMAGIAVEAAGFLAEVARRAPRDL